MHRPARWLAVIAAGSLVLLGTAPAAASGADPVTFAPQADYPVGQYPWEIATADLNGDAKQDLVTVNRLSDSVSINLGKGDGTFLPKTDFATGDLPFFVAVADFDRDRDVDLVVSRYAANAVSILLGNGNGTFRAPTDFTTGVGPQAAKVADLDGDGKLDIVTGNWEADTISVLRGVGDGTFAAKTDFPTGNGPAGLAVFDITGDGKLDVLTANFFGDTVSLVPGNGDGTFGAPTDIVTGDTADSVVVADLNQDGKADVVTGNHFIDTVSVLLGNGDGTFGAAVQYPTGYRSNDIAVADMDGDGLIDIVTCNWGPDQSDPDPTEVGTVSVLAGNGDGTFGTNVDHPVGPITPAFDLADFNTDGKPDVAVTNHNLHSTSVLLNTTGNQAPVAADDTYQFSGKEVLSVPAPGVLANDSDPEGGALSATLVTGPAKGTLVLRPDGSFDFTADKKKFKEGTDTFTYTVTDGSATSAPATVTLEKTK